MSQNHQPNPATSNPEPFLPCERLDVYRLALEFRQSLGMLDSVRNISALRDQIYRASESVVLNIAEGAGRHAHADKRRHYSYAMGSAMKAAIPRGGFDESIIQKRKRVQCGAALALLHARGALGIEAYQQRRMMIIRIAQMLSRLCGPPR